MDLLSLVGLLLGIAAIIGGNALEGGHIDALINGPALIIVIGGTVGAALLQTPLPTFMRSMRLMPWVFRPPATGTDPVIERVLEWSGIARREGLLGLEAIADQAGDAFARKGLQLLVDGVEPQAIRGMLEGDVYAAERRDVQAAKVFDGMGGYSPTIGIIGAVMGLIHVMQNLADPSRLGPGIATAFVATIYGVGLANLVFLPFANKIKAQVQAQARQREILVEGLVAIAEGENPRNIETRLRGIV